jgi:hypothetical protein
LPETYFLSVIMAADAQARPFLQFQASKTKMMLAPTSAGPKLIDLLSHAGEEQLSAAVED